MCCQKVLPTSVLSPSAHVKIISDNTIVGTRVDIKELN